METSEVLMLHGTVARCPDCADECVLVPTDGLDGYCCTSCDAAVFAPDLADGRGDGAAGGPVDRAAGRTAARGRRLAG